MNDWKLVRYMTFKVDTIYVKDNEQVVFDIRILVDSVEYKQRLTKEL